uniref:Uncharacterized protein n=1 Tax=Anguilla anguilla TaxID=7936 RepID=A0A0E9V0N8_ANGAN
MCITHIHIVYTSTSFGIIIHQSFICIPPCIQYINAPAVLA